MKRLLGFLLMAFMLGIPIADAQPFGPPIYIADPAKMDCKYYFAGDKGHFNPRPEEYTVDIGYTTDFKSQEQACEFFRCVQTNGTIVVDENKKPVEKNLCVCPQNEYWDDVLGCVKMKETEEPITFLQLIWRWVNKIF